MGLKVGLVTLIVVATLSFIVLIWPAVGTPPWQLGYPMTKEFKDQLAQDAYGLPWADLTTDRQKKISEHPGVQEMTIKGLSLGLDKPLFLQRYEEEQETAPRMRDQLPEAARKEIERLAVNVGVARSGEGYRYNDQRYEHYQKQTVKLASQVLPQLMERPAYKEADSATQKAMAERVIAAVRKEVRLTVDKMTAVPAGAAKNIMAYESFKEAGDETKASFAQLPGVKELDLTLSEVGKTLNVASNTDIKLNYEERAELQRNRYKYIEQLYNKVTASESYKKLKTDQQRKDVIEKYVTGPAGERARGELQKKLGVTEIKRRIASQKAKEAPTPAPTQAEQKPNQAPPSYRLGAVVK